MHPTGKLSIGRDVRMNSGNLINSFGGHRKTIIRVLKNAELRIGSNVGISNSTFICSKEIIIEDDVMIGGDCYIVDTDFHSINYIDRMANDNIRRAKVVIGKGVFIGGRSMLLKGITIGNYSVVGAGSVVTKSIPPCEIWGGNPAQFIRTLN